MQEFIQKALLIIMFLLIAGSIFFFVRSFKQTRENSYESKTEYLLRVICKLLAGIQIAIIAVGISMYLF